MNAVVKACVQCNDIKRAITVYQEMLQPDSCGVDNITYGILLKGLGEALRLDDVFELLEEIEAGTAPGNPVLSDVHLNTLVNACVEAGDSLRARGALLRYRLSVQGSRPSILTYNLLIKGFARSDNPLEALKVREEMINNELQPQRLTYNTLIFACVRGGDMEKALELFKEMKTPSTCQQEAFEYINSDQNAQLCLRVVQWLEAQASKELDYEKKILQPCSLHQASQQ
ncbi:unnamed protein product [Calypogeia fissa]